jgi:hypothetical protein
LINCLKEANKSGSTYDYGQLFELLEALVPTDDTIEQIRQEGGIKEAQ